MQKGKIFAYMVFWKTGPILQRSHTKLKGYELFLAKYMAIFFSYNLFRTKSIKMLRVYKVENSKFG